MGRHRFLFLLPNLALGGAERAIVRYVDALSRAGHHAEILLIENHIEVPTGGAPISALLRGPVGHGLVSRSMAALLLRRWFITRKFDLVVSTLPFMDRIAAMARIPNLAFRIANDLGSEVRALRDPKRAMRRLTRYRRLYVGRPLIAVSNGVAEGLVEALQVPRASIRTMFNPFDFELLRRQSEDLPKDIPPRPFLLSASRFASQKRHDLLLDAFSQIKGEVILALLTAPSAGLDALISERGLEGRVVVLGSRSNPYPYMRAARAVVLTSDREGLPNVLVEAMAVGTPVVSTDCPSGPAEVLTGGLRDFLVPVGDVDALASTLIRVIQNPPNIGSVDLSRFGVERFVADMEQLVEDMQRGN